MDTIDWIDNVLSWSCGLGAIVTFAVLLSGIWHGLQRSTGRTAGRVPGLLRRPLFYLVASAGYIGLCYWLWQPIPLFLSRYGRVIAVLVGGLVFFAGLALVLWGRLALGKLYFVSSMMGAQVFADHRLVTGGPYALVRHPIYLGVLFSGLGGILLYRTWTMIFVALTALGLALRARREEQVLAAEFGEEWQAYCRRVPAFLPRVSGLIRPKNKK
jgi:protein-S-isoprenylcysteine O-methyltransferase Ste14